MPKKYNKPLKLLKSIKSMKTTKKKSLETTM